MRTRIFWIFFAVIAFVILIPVSISVYKDWQVYSKGTLVKVELTSLPRSTSGFIKFKMDGRIFDKRLSGNVNSSVNVGDTIQLKYLKGYEGHFLFADENPMSWDILAIAIALFLGIACLYYAFKKDPPPVQAFGRKLS
jgi:uncharacterized BrkB/YihY/UPF0761 family membrane protein